MNTFSNSIWNGEVTLTRNRMWNRDTVRQACINNDL